MRNAFPKESTAQQILALINEARHALKGVTKNSPCLLSPELSDITNSTVCLKFENRQHTSSFKERGAYFKLISLTPSEKQKGIIAMSAGNHAQAVSYHAQKLNIPCTIVMPKFTPDVKIRHTKKFNAEVIIHGHSLEEAADLANELQEERKLTLIHPYDDKYIIAGQGTIAHEVIQSFPETEVLIVPIGGGGLISGISLAAKRLNPNITVIGVEAARYPSMQQAIAGKPIQCGRTTLADGIGVKRPGQITQKIIKKYVDDILLVDELAIERAVLLLLQKEKTVVEGAGAVALAALLTHPQQFHGKKVCLLLSGGNIDMPVLSLIIQRGMERAQRLVRLVVTLRDIPGALGNVCQKIEQTYANIINISHRRTFTKLPLEAVEVTILLQTQGAEHIEEIITMLNNEDVQCKLADH
ncbi:MAG: threonine ammonia-lyase [Gammaproteobacteria bacterium]|nr:threonine ammonia-lyase [Gammaproteobacteria bacterium]